METLNKWALVFIAVVVGGYFVVQITVWHYNATTAINNINARVTAIEKLLVPGPVKNAPVRD